MVMSLEKKTRVQIVANSSHLLGNHIKGALGPAIEGVVSQGRLGCLHKETTTLRNGFTCFQYSNSMIIGLGCNQAKNENDGSSAEDLEWIQIQMGPWIRGSK
jgi:hypothetical protein